MDLIHEPNTVQWRVGDLVIHDSDVKRADMLMIVLGQERSGVFRTRYAFPWAQPRPWRRKIWRNSIEWLHDPARFGITVARLAPTSRESLDGNAHQDQSECDTTPAPSGEPIPVVVPNRPLQADE
ncbi:hypothetical protein KIH07_17010 [Hydrogenophaga taeniospiralis]|uniref:hypothetical protein n=1 Tax=Hydrogenophaga taeniospiralis TaxID=65656 RepID=UPI001CFC05D7|nr:hypothetical protein [Hydrogenophaga taeniospiralis]MCB4365446.1 hypothetical protein [Hydrogenophaga taeniospiralis]